MIKNYFKVAFRNLVRNKGFSAINIAGLAIGMASAILILLWIQNEISYDRFHKNGAYLYEAWNRGIANNKLDCWETTPKILATTLKLEYPEIANVSRTENRWFVTSAGEKKLSTQAMFADPSFFQMFSFPFLHGNQKTALTNMYDIAVTEKMAIKMFGTTDAMGKIIKIDQDNFTVQAVLKDLPTNTQFDFDYVLPWLYHTRLDGEDLSWGDNSVNTYVQLQPNANPAMVNAAIMNITKKHSNGEEKVEVFLHPISKWHLYSTFENGKIAGGRISVVITFGIIAAFILLIACINFMNLSTARSEKRAREVGIRKVIGAGKASLIGQFLGESMLISLIAGAIALLLVQLSLDGFDQLTSKALVVPYTNIYFWITALLFVFSTGALAGSYPAFFLSSFKPVVVLKGSFKKSHALINPRKVLVVLQFSFAIILIVSTVIVTQQLRYAQARETGYDRGQLMYHFLTGELNTKYPLVKKDLLSAGVAVAVTKTYSPLTEGWRNTWSLQWNGKAPDDKTIFDEFSEDEGLAKTAGLTVIAGRDMDLTAFATDSTAVVMNESAAKAMHFAAPIGQVIKNHDKEWHIVGVIKDFILRSPYKQTYPMVIFGSKDEFNVINIKLNTANSTAANMQVIEKIFKAYNPQYPFEYHFVDEQYARKFGDTKRTATLIGIFAALTIFISCLGLFGLTAYMAESRIKEIGVRKVLGASVTGIATLLSKDFLELVIISLLIASPLAWLLMSKWLQDYPYHTSIHWWVFAMAGAMALLVSLITVSFQAIKAAVANPVKSLRNE
ncbi:MAG: ABC transporter permease [Bacteroidota bacterium]